MAGNNTQRIIVLIAIGAVVLLIGILYWLLWKPPTELCKTDPEVCPCLKLLPDDRQLKIEFEIDDSKKLVSIDFGGSSGPNDHVSSDLAEEFVQCIKGTSNDIEVINFSRIVTSPLGQVAHQWGRSNGLKIILRPPSAEDQTVINNLQIGPDGGMRWRIMEKWCMSDMKDCVRCDALDEGQNTVGIEVRLKEGAPLVKKFWSDGWPTDNVVRQKDNVVRQKDNVVRQKWELVDNDGNRYLYECRPE